MTFTVTTLAKTWLIDIDGTIFAHNGYKDGEDSLLSGVAEFFVKIPKDDKIVLLSAREEKHRAVTEAALARFGLRYDQLLLGLPPGERILINDNKPSGLPMAFALNVKRNAGLCEVDGEIVCSGEL